jgi:NADH-quinone oxidoreductase subunit F
MMEIPLVDVYGVATFYTSFSLEPKGRHIVTVCMGTACHVRNSTGILQEICRFLHVEAGGTTEDMAFTVETVNCLGACAMGPIMVVDGRYYGEMNASKVVAILEKYMVDDRPAVPAKGALADIREFESYREAVAATRYSGARSVSVCNGPGCLARGGREVAQVFRKTMRSAGLGSGVIERETGCHGFCEMGPVVLIRPDDIFYSKVTPADVPEIVEETLINGRPVSRLLYVDEDTGAACGNESQVPFYGRQLRKVLGPNRLIDPYDIDDYIGIGGYSALASVLGSMQPEEVIDEVERAGLRGRGGGGFPAADKWRAARRARSVDGVKYVLCNADEGDPGAFMDRCLLEGNPHSVLEGMLIGAYAIGATNGYVYVRNEYPLAVESITRAIEQARDKGLLGPDILGSGFNFEVGVSRGGGAFVCGESTALMASIEGRIGEPREKYVHTAVRGLYLRPTNLNNVETWANVPVVIREGAEKFSSVGTAGSKGTKIFSLVGKIRNTGLVEVPMGITLREIIYEIGGGIPGGKTFKAVQTGGPSGGCIPASLLDIPVDFDQLYDVGSMMGSGGMIVMDEDTCMVDIALYFLDFLGKESCGKCTPCREGIKHMYGIVEDIAGGRGTAEQLDLLEELAEVVKDTSLCGLGQTAANPVLSTIRYFRDEYLDHIERRVCPAGVCQELISYSIDPDACDGCMRCNVSCPAEAITGEKRTAHAIDVDKCRKCGICLEVCGRGAVIRK